MTAQPQTLKTPSLIWAIAIPETVCFLIFKLEILYQLVETNVQENILKKVCRLERMLLRYNGGTHGACTTAVTINAIL